MYRAERVTIAAIVLFMLGLTGLGLLSGYPRQAILFPIIASVLAVAFAALRFWETSRKLAGLAEGQGAEARKELEEDAGELEVAAAVRPFLWVFAALVFLWLFGFLAGLTLYVFVFLLAHRIGLLTAVLVAVGTLVFVFVVFQIVLGVLLPVGLIPDLMGV